MWRLNLPDRDWCGMLGQTVAVRLKTRAARTTFFCESLITYCRQTCGSRSWLKSFC